jgi:hypothetical protein
MAYQRPGFRFFYIFSKADRLGAIIEHDLAGAVTPARAHFGLEAQVPDVPYEVGSGSADAKNLGSARESV